MRVLAIILAIFSAALPASAAPRPLRFDHALLGNVVRVLSARFHAPITVETGAAARVSGDFTKMNLRQALTETARQAGLEAVPLGKDDSFGYVIKARAAAPAATDSDDHRAALLQRRAELLRQAATLGTPAPSP